MAAITWLAVLVTAPLASEARATRTALPATVTASGWFGPVGASRRAVSELPPM
jgi:hypothetical protein